LLHKICSFRFLVVVSVQTVGQHKWAAVGATSKEKKEKEREVKAPLSVCPFAYKTISLSHHHDHSKNGFKTT